LNITSATEFNAGDGFIIDPLLLLLPAFVAAAPLLVEICAATKEAAEIKNAVLLENAAIGSIESMKKSLNSVKHLLEPLPYFVAVRDFTSKLAIFRRQNRQLRKAKTN
jgi:hypothetical protein